MWSYVQKIWKYKWITRSIIHSIYFNFHYLPLKQAIKLPIILYKPKLLKCKGKITIIGEIRTGMIQLGRNIVSIYPNSGFTYENKGGIITFCGNCIIGNNSFISIGKTGKVNFGKDFFATTTFKLICYNYIYFHDSVTVGWDCLFMDTDLHKMIKLSGGYTKGYGKIDIGNNNWFGTKSIILKNTVTPNFCTISAFSKLNRRYTLPEYSVIGTKNDIEVIASGRYLNSKDNKITYE